MSLNPFTNKRKKKEEEFSERIEALQAERALQSSFETPSSADAPPVYSLPDAETSDTYENEDFNKYLPATAQMDQPTSGYKGIQTYEPPSRARQCLSKLQSGFTIGAALGGAFGFMYGTYAAIVHRHVLYLPIAVVQAGGAFGFFLACGTVIRCREPEEFCDIAGISDLEVSALASAASKPLALAAQAQSSSCQQRSEVLRAAFPPSPAAVQRSPWWAHP